MKANLRRIWRQILMTLMTSSCEKAQSLKPRHNWVMYISLWSLIEITVMINKRSPSRIRKCLRVRGRNSNRSQCLPIRWLVPNSLCLNPKISCRIAKLIWLERWALIQRQIHQTRTFSANPKRCSSAIRTLRNSTVSKNSMSIRNFTTRKCSWPAMLKSLSAIMLFRSSALTYMEPQTLTCRLLVIRGIICNKSTLQPLQPKKGRSVKLHLLNSAT